MKNAGAASGSALAQTAIAACRRRLIVARAAFGGIAASIASAT
jgi:hypothetical protein